MPRVRKPKTDLAHWFIFDGYITANLLYDKLYEKFFARVSTQFFFVDAEHKKCYGYFFFPCFTSLAALRRQLPFMNIDKSSRDAIVEKYWSVPLKDFFPHGSLLLFTRVQLVLGAPYQVLPREGLPPADNN